MGSDLACLLLLLQSGEQSGWVLNPPKRRAGVSEGAPLAWKEAPGGMGGSSSKASEQG